MYKNLKEFLINRYDPIVNSTISYKNEKEVRLSKILARLKPTDLKMRILDIGCYDGYIGSLIKKALGNNSEVFGIDVAKNTIKLAKKYGIKAKICDITNGIPYPGNKFDYVFAGEIIEHTLDTDFFLKEIKRILKPNGILIITTPNTLSLGRRVFYLFGKGIYLEQSFNLPKNAAGHIRYFTFENLKKLTEMHKFITIKSFSDIVNLHFFVSTIMARLFPTFGQSIIVFLKNEK